MATDTPSKTPTTTTATTDTTTTATTATAAKDEIRQQNALYELLVNSNAKVAEQNRLLKERADILELSADLLKSQTELQDSIATKLLNTVKSTEKFAAFQAEVNELRKKDANLRSEEEEATLRLLQIQVGLNEAGEKQTLESILQGDNEQAEIDALEKAKAINGDFLALQGKIKGVSEKVAGSMGLSANFSETFLGKAVDLKTRFDQIGGLLGPGGMSGMLKNIVGQSFNFKNFFLIFLNLLLNLP